jgi:hypothetical protein
MWKTFNAVMRIFSSLLGLLVAFLGVVWMLQGLNLAFNGPMMGGQKSFMVGDPMWIFFGLIAAVLGIAQVVWSNRRQSAE